MEYDQQHQQPNANEYQLDSLEPNSSLMSAFVPSSNNSAGPQRPRRSTQGIYHHPYVNTGTNIGGNGMNKQSRKASTSSQSENESPVTSAINAVTNDRQANSTRQTDNTPFKSYLEPVHDEENRLCWLRCTFCKVFPERGGANAHSTTPDRIRKHLPACKGHVPEEVRSAAAHGIRTGSITLKETTNQAFTQPQAQTPKREETKQRRKSRFSTTSASTTTTTTPTLDNISTSNQANSTNLANGIALDQLHVLKSRLDLIEVRTPKEMTALKQEILSIHRDMKSLNGKVEQLLGYMVMNSHFQQAQSNTPRQSPMLSQFPMNNTQEVSPTHVQDRIQVVRLANDEDSPTPPESEQPRQMPNTQQSNNQPQFRDNWFAESNNLVDVQ
ncbi:hypothetical protein E3Q18_01239 [Wallemia mellicola]|nr:hypothetical protein E3Q18_01239 [Wallemia mellicola]